MEQTYFTRRRLTLRLLSIAIYGLAFLPAAQAGEVKDVKIGMAKSFLDGKSKTLVDIAAAEFKQVLKKATGLNGDLVSKYGAFEVADKLENGQLDFGVLHAHEFAWVKKSHPDLLTLLVAVNKQHSERAFLIVQTTCDAKSCADLRGKKLDIPAGNSEPSRMYLDRLAAKLNPKGVASFFGPIAKSASASDALNELARGKVDVVLVNAAGLEFYKEIRGPIFAKNLRVLQQSDPFPPPVIVHKKGAPAEAILAQFRAGLLKANTLPLGLAMMKSWNVDAFEGISIDYSKSLAEVLKSYPVPDSHR